MSMISKRQIMLASSVTLVWLLAALVGTCLSQPSTSSSPSSPTSSSSIPFNVDLKHAIDLTRFLRTKYPEEAGNGHRSLLAASLAVASSGLRPGLSRIYLGAPWLKSSAVPTLIPGGVFRCSLEFMANRVDHQVDCDQVEFNDGEFSRIIPGGLNCSLCFCPIAQ